MTCTFCGEIFIVTFEDEDAEVRFCPSCGAEIESELDMEEWPDDELWIEGDE